MELVYLFKAREAYEMLLVLGKQNISLVCH